jgi:L-cysteine desulfidase
MGCTEPIAVAYAAARAAAVPGGLPDRVRIEASDNIVKNVKSVMVPNTGGLRGISAAAAAGIAAGDADKMLDLNMAIAERGVTGEGGANIGTVLLDVWGDDIKVRARAMAAAGWDGTACGRPTGRSSA